MCVKLLSLQSILFVLVFASLYFHDLIIVIFLILQVHLVALPSEEKDDEVWSVFCAIFCVNCCDKRQLQCNKCFHCALSQFLFDQFSCISGVVCRYFSTFFAFISQRQRQLLLQQAKDQIDSSEVCCVWFVFNVSFLCHKINLHLLT